jgi:hypothetical protein
LRPRLIVADERKGRGRKKRELEWLLGGKPREEKPFLGMSLTRNERLLVIAVLAATLLLFLQALLWPR